MLQAKLFTEKRFKKFTPSKFYSWLNEVTQDKKFFGIDFKVDLKQSEIDEYNAILEEFCLEPLKAGEMAK